MADSKLIERVRRKCTLKTRNWMQWKAAQLRSSWRGRAKKLGLPLHDIPTRLEIETLLRGYNDKFICYLSGDRVLRHNLEIDHKLPTSRGGSFRLDNVGITNKYWNSVKGSMTHTEFIELLRLVSTWDDKGASLFKRLSVANIIFKRRKY